MRGCCGPLNFPVVARAAESSACSAFGAQHVAAAAAARSELRAPSPALASRAGGMEPQG